MSKSSIPSTYVLLLADLKASVRAAQVRAAVAVNPGLILLYGHVGGEILRAQSRLKLERSGASQIRQRQTRRARRGPRQYALRDVKKPIGVAQWQTRLVESLPKNLRGSLPTIADIERELSKPSRPKSEAKSKTKSKP